MPIPILIDYVRIFSFSFYGNISESIGKTEMYVTYLERSRTELIIV